MTIILELPDNTEAVLKARAQSEGVSAEQYAANVLNRSLDQPPIDAASLTTQRHISETIREIWSDVPAEAWNDFPTDGASEHDHYIYGLPKRNA